MSGRLLGGSPAAHPLPACVVPAAPEPCLLLDEEPALPSTGRGTRREAREENASPRLTDEAGLSG